MNINCNENRECFLSSKMNSQESTSNNLDSDLLPLKIQKEKKYIKKEFPKKIMTHRAVESAPERL